MVGSKRELEEGWKLSRVRGRVVRCQVLIGKSVSCHLL